MIGTSNMNIYIYFSDETLTRSIITNDYQYTEKYHNGLQPADNSARVKIVWDLQLAEKLKTYSGEQIKVQIKQFGTNKLTGYVRNNFTFTKVQLNQPISFEIINPSFLLDIDTDRPVQFVNNRIDSIITSLLSLCGFTQLRTLNIPTIISFFGLDEGENIYDALATLCKEYGYTFTFDADGYFVLLPLFNSPSGTIANTFTGQNCFEEIVLKKTELKADAVQVEWNKVELVTNTLIFSDTQGGNATYKCIIQVQPTKYLFDKVENYLPYDSTLGEIKYVTGFVPSIVHDNQIRIDKLLNLGKKAVISAYNTSSSGQYRFTKMDITGNAYIDKGVNYSGELLGARKIEKVKAKYLYDETSVNTYVSNLLNYYKYSDFEVELSSKANYPLGSFVQVSDTGLGTTTGRIIQKKLGLQSEVIEYTIEAISEYQIEVIPPAIGSNNTNQDQTKQDIFDELKDGAVIIGTNGNVSDITAPTIPVIINGIPNSNGTISITFTSSEDLESGVSFYKVYRKGQESIFTSLETITHVPGQVSYVYTDVSTIHGTEYQYKVTAVDFRGNESAYSSVSTISAQVTIAPTDPSTITSIADNENFIKVDVGTAVTLNPIYKADTYIYEISRNSGISWTQIATTKSNSFVYYYNRSVDNYPEVSTLANYRFRVAVKSVYGVQSAFLVCTPVTTSYKTWIPTIPVLVTRAGGRNGTISWDKQDNLYGVVEYVLQISKDNANWYKPASGLDVYASVDNWKIGSLNDSLSLPIESFAQGLPLTGQNSTPPVVLDTSYSYRVLRKNKTTGISSASVTVTLVATATSAKDIVNNAISTAHIVDDAVTADKIYVSALSAITANIGLITDGAIGSSVNNKWDLTNGTFKIGNGTTDVLSFDTINGLQIVTSNFDATAGSFDMAGTFRVGTIIENKIASNVAFYVNPNGTGCKVVSSRNDDLTTLANDYNNLELQSQNSGSNNRPVAIAFHQAGYFASKITLGVDHAYHFGGWSHSVDEAPIKCGIASVSGIQIGKNAGTFIFGNGMCAGNTSGILVKTDIPYNSNCMVELSISGNSYTAGTPIDGKIQCYVYGSGSCIYPPSLSYRLIGAGPTEVYLFMLNGYLCLWHSQAIPSQTYRYALSTSYTGGVFSIVEVTNEVIPASRAWGQMLLSSGVVTNKVTTDAITAGTYSSFGIGQIVKHMRWTNSPGVDANTQPANEMGFSYAYNAPYNGWLGHFGTAGGNGGYGIQLNTKYGDDGNAVSFRSRNGDNSTWNSWRDFVLSKDGEVTIGTTSGATLTIGNTKIWGGAEKIQIGSGTYYAGTRCVAIGHNAVANTNDSIAIGHGANAAYAYHIAIGKNATTTASLTSREINIGNKLRYFEFPIGTTRGTIYAALSPLVLSVVNTHITSCGALSTGNWISIIKRETATSIQFWQEDTTPLDSFYLNQTTTITYNIKVFFIQTT